MNAQTHTASTSFVSAASSTLQALYVLGFAVLTAIGAQLVVPHDPVPFTMQTLFVLLAGGVLGRHNGALSMGAYLLAGALGLPVFSGAGFGLLRILGPTGGYLLAFPVAAFVVGSLLDVQRVSVVRIVASLFTGLLVIFSMGTLHLYLFTPLNVGDAVSSGFLIFSVWDLAKLAVATAIVYRVHHRRGA